MDKEGQELVLDWINKSTKIVQDITPSLSDRQMIEMDLAKLKVLIDDIESRSVDSLDAARKRFLASGTSDSMNTTELNDKWNDLRNLALDKQGQLEHMLHLIKSVVINEKIKHLLARLQDFYNQLPSSMPAGGLPEKVQEKLNKFMELYHKIETKRHTVESTLAQGAEIVAMASEGTANNLQHSLKQLKKKWGQILNGANDRKKILELALRDATEFHEAMNKSDGWCSSAEKYLKNAPPVSRVLSNLIIQVEEHKTFQRGVAAHRAELALEKKAIQLEYSKHYVQLIKNKMNRWERIASKTAEREQALEAGLKETKKFFDSWTDITDWLTETENNFDQSLDQKSPDCIKIMLAKHKEKKKSLDEEFKRTYDAIMKEGMTLKDNAPRNDETILENILNELRNKWYSVCKLSDDRQLELEQCLLFFGQFRDAVDALKEWLHLHGDLDTVTSLVKQHNSFEEAFKLRTEELAYVRSLAAGILSVASAEDSSVIKLQIDTLESKWEEVTLLFNEQKFHSSRKVLLEWITDKENYFLELEPNEQLPEDEEEARVMTMEDDQFLEELEQQKLNKDSLIWLGKKIVSKKSIHPDTIDNISQWIAMIEKMWDDIAAFGKGKVKSDKMRTVPEDDEEEEEGQSKAPGQKEKAKGGRPKKGWTKNGCKIGAKNTEIAS